MFEKFITFSGVGTLAEVRELKTKPKPGSSDAQRVWRRTIKLSLDGIATELVVPDEQSDFDAFEVIWGEVGGKSPAIRSGALVKVAGRMKASLGGETMLEVSRIERVDEVEMAKQWIAQQEAKKAAKANGAGTVEANRAALQAQR